MKTVKESSGSNSSEGLRIGFVFYLNGLRLIGPFPTAAVIVTKKREKGKEKMNDFLQFEKTTIT